MAAGRDLIRESAEGVVEFLSQPASSSRACQRAYADGQVTLQVLQAVPRPGDLVTIFAVEGRVSHRRVQFLHGVLEQLDPARQAFQLLAFLEAQFPGLFAWWV